MRRLLALAVLATVAASGSSVPESAFAATQDVAVPASIVSDCSADVWASLAQFLNSVPDDTTVNFAAGGCYRVERQMDLNAKSGVVLDGHGATLVRTQPTPGMLRYPHSNAFLRLLQWKHGGVRQLNIQGTNQLSDKVELRYGYGAWDQSMEFDAGINVRGGSDLLLANLRIDGTFGDGIQIQRWKGQPRNIVVRDVSISHNGRQGISVSAASGVLIDRVDIVGSRRSGIDIEPAADTMVAENIEIRNSTINSWLLAFPSQGNGLANHIYIHDNRITRTGVPFVMSRSTAGLRRTDWRIVNNTVTYGLGSSVPAMAFDNTTSVLVDGNMLTLKDGRARLAVGLIDGSTATITNNWFRGGLPAPDFVKTDTTSIWVGGNNSITDAAPSLVRWTPLGITI